MTQRERYLISLTLSGFIRYLSVVLDKNLRFMIMYQI